MFRLYYLRRIYYVQAMTDEANILCLGYEMDICYVQAMIDEADIDGDGQINYEEFYQMMNSS